MDINNNKPKPLQQQQQPQPQPLCISPPPPTMPYHYSHFLLPFPPTTPTSSPSTITHHKKHRSKLFPTETTTTRQREPPLKTPKHYSLSNNNDEAVPPCTECGKIFWSKKALFGHMRCHPERPWRGIVPPRNLPLPTTTNDDHEVAASLLMLASGPEIGASPPPPPPASSPIAKFECSSCKKFGSHQALGGHRASHKNIKGSFAITKTTTDFEDDQCMFVHGVQNNEGIGLDLSLGFGLGLGTGHRCGVCLKVFPTGQALGGHMRCHWEKNVEQHQQAQASSSSFGLGIGPVSKPNEDQCGLDLNYPAQA